VGISLPFALSNSNNNTNERSQESEIDEMLTKEEKRRELQLKT
jgi:hypothetical protein